MLANAGDITHTAMEEQQQEVEEIRTIRMLDRDNLAEETVEMEVEEEENRERTVARGRGRGNGRGRRHRDYRN